MPALRFAGDLSFLTAERPTGQGVAGVLGRAVLKGGDLLGLAGTVVAVVVVVLVVRAAGPSAAPPSVSAWLLVVVGVQLAVWLWLPAEPSYLLPALVAAARVGRPAAARRPRCATALAVLVGALALYAVVDVRLVEVDHENRYGYDTCDRRGHRRPFRPHVANGTRCSGTRR